MAEVRRAFINQRNRRLSNSSAGAKLCVESILNCARFEGSPVYMRENQAAGFDRSQN